jgi:hypothetical protein
MIEILLYGVVVDTASDELIADRIKYHYKAIGWKNVTTRPKEPGKEALC